MTATSATQFLRRVFIHQRHHIGHQPAAAEAGEKAEDAELGRCAGEAIEHGGAAEQYEADGNAFLATDAVSQGAEDQRAEHHPEQRVTTQRTSFQWGQPPFLHDHRQHYAIDEQVVAVEDQQQCAEAHDEPMEAAEARVIDDFVNIYFSHGKTLYCFC